ncbi:MAG TPA: AbgT family transporter [Acetobacteraceae bacterium]|nr:AbgT family transporter [Acetobacteraceae bacterium]
MTERVVEPRLGRYHSGEPIASTASTRSDEEACGLPYALYVLLCVVVVIAMLTLPANAPLRNPATGALIGGRRS